MANISNVLPAYSLYCAVCVCVYIFILRRNGADAPLFRLLISLCVPPFGLAFMFYKHTEAESVPERDESGAAAAQPPNPEMDKLRVPMSEAVALNDHTVCCALLLDALKDDPINYLTGIREALADGDPETSHYAAAAVIDIRGGILDKVRRMGGNPCLDDEEEIYNYEEILIKSLNSRIFDAYSETKLQSALEDILNHMMAVKPSAKVYADRTWLEMYRGNYKEALAFANQYLDKYPEEEEASAYVIQCLTALRDISGLRGFTKNNRGDYENMCCC